MAKLTKRQRAKVRRYAVYALSVGFVLFVGAKIDWPKLSEAFFDTEIFAEQFPRVLTVAARNTLIYTFFGFLGGLTFGLVLALMRLSSIAPYRWAAGIYIEIFRGLPAIITLVLVGFVLPLALKIKIPGIYGAGAVGLTLVYSAYMAETIRAGIQAIPKGQMEAARSLGMSPWRSMVSIIIPQALRIIIPPLTNEFVALVKDTSLIFVLGTTSDNLDLAKFGRDAVSDTFNGTPLVVVALVYLAITIPLTQLVSYMERRAKRASA